MAIVYVFRSGWGHFERLGVEQYIFKITAIGNSNQVGHNSTSIKNPSKLNLV